MGGDFGRLYRAAIKAGVLSIMSAHIALSGLRALARSGCPSRGFPSCLDQPAAQYRAAAERLGFNGLIVSDATGMAGFGAWSARDEAMPQIIAGGCDVILFSHDPDADAVARGGVARGDLEQERVDDAVMRVLAFKAALGLHRAAPVQPEAGARQRTRTGAAAGITARSPTLVKDTQQLLPLDLDQTSPRARRHAGDRRAVPAATASLRLAGNARGRRLAVTMHAARAWRSFPPITTSSSTSSARRLCSRAATSSSTGSD